jgi:hypothetical protein
MKTERYKQEIPVRPKVGRLRDESDCFIVAKKFL